MSLSDIAYKSTGFVMLSKVFGGMKFDCLKLTDFAYNKRSLKNPVNVFGTDSAVVMFTVVCVWSIQGR